MTPRIPRPWIWPIAGLATLAAMVIVVVLEPFSPRHRELVRGDREATALRDRAEQTMTALKSQLKDPLKDYFGELWLADGRLVCGFVDVRDGSPSYGGWEPFVGEGGVLYRITDRSPRAREWFRVCARGPSRLVYPGAPGEADMPAWVHPPGIRQAAGS
jgi:hypothetical protein